MKLIDKIKIKHSLRKLSKLTNKKMCPVDANEILETIKKALLIANNAPYIQKRKFLNICLDILKRG